MMHSDQQAAGTILSRRRRWEMGARCLELCCVLLSDSESQCVRQSSGEAELDDAGNERALIDRTLQKIKVPGAYIDSC